MQISRNKVVTIHYTLSNGEGQVIESSKGRDALAYIHGVGGLIPGLEGALEGKAEGDQVHVSVPPEQAYGVKDDTLVQEVPRRLFEGVPELQVGMQFRAQGDGEPRVVTVTSIEDDKITVDGNHPLAGETLNFDVDVVNVRDANEEELAHGHVHGPGGQQH